MLFFYFQLHELLTFLFIIGVVAVVFCRVYSANHEVWQRYPAFKREMTKWHYSTSDIFSCSHLNASELFLSTWMKEVFILESLKRRSTKIMKRKVHNSSLFPCDVAKCIIRILSWTKSCHFAKRIFPFNIFLFEASGFLFYFHFKLPEMLRILLTPLNFPLNFLQKKKCCFFGIDFSFFFHHFSVLILA